MKSLQRRNIAIFLFFVIGIAAVFSILYPLLLVHDMYLRNLNMSFMEMRHPAGTQLVASASEIGLLTGNGDHCDYLVAEMRSYSISKRQIIDAYRNRKIWNPMSKSWDSIAVAFVDNEKIIVPSDFAYEVDPKILKERFQNFFAQTYTSRIYFVVFFDVGYDAGVDVRCM